MKKIFFIILTTSAIFLGCNSETESNSTEEKTTEESEIVNIDLMTDEQLYKYMVDLEKKIYQEDSLELSREYSVKMLEAAQKHVERYPESLHRRAAIRKGARASQGLNQDYEAVRLLDFSIKENQNDSTIIEEMNHKAFLYDKMESRENAKKAYQAVIDKFPNAPESAMHKERLKTIDMSTKELMKHFEKKNAK